MVDTRHHFHEELAALEESTLDIGERAERMVSMAVQAVVSNDVELADRVVALDDELDLEYAQVHDRWINLMARQSPMGKDLRLMSALLHLNITLERMGDQAVNIAKITKVTRALPRSDRIIEQLKEMGDLVLPMVRTAIQAFTRRDLEEALLLPAMDEPIDRLNRNMYRAVVSCGKDEHLLEWATRMMMVSRALERIGHQSVDVGEQLAYLITGEIQEFTDQSDERHDGG